jgi:L-alanine-DL-glutamate epimerase-like enolase superfamily enzyme
MDQDVAELAAIRKAFGNHVDIALKCAETFPVRSAIQFANVLALYHPPFMDEPTLCAVPAALQAP